MPTPSRTSREAIVLAAREILEADGLEALTMQRVAVSVGVRAPSLYKHVRNRAELVRLVIEAVATDLTDTVDRAATTGDPGSDLRAIAHAVRRFAHAHPRGYGLVFADLPEEWRASPQTLGRANEALLRTTAALAGSDLALDAARMVVAWAHGFLSMELADAFRLGGSVDDAFGFGIDRLGAALATSRAR
jgi:AcrR family transcriptional regulator